MGQEKSAAYALTFSPLSARDSTSSACAIQQLPPQQVSSPLWIALVRLHLNENLGIILLADQLRDFQCLLGFVLETLRSIFSITAYNLSLPSMSHLEFPFVFLQRGSKMVTFNYLIIVTQYCPDNRIVCSRLYLLISTQQKSTKIPMIEGE